MTTPYGYNMETGITNMQMNEQLWLCSNMTCKVQLFVFLASCSCLTHHNANEKIKTIQMLDNNIVMFLLLDIKMCVCKIPKQFRRMICKWHTVLEINDGILCNYEMNILPLSMHQE